MKPIIDIRVEKGKTRYYVWDTEVSAGVAEEILRLYCPTHEPNRHGYCKKCGALIDKRPDNQVQS